jgi:glycerophosphoryl diester phosphodiesterase
MANIPFKSITFPGLPNKYTVPEISNDLMTAGKAADAKATGDALSALEDQFSEETDKLKADLDDVETSLGKTVLPYTVTVGGSINFSNGSDTTSEYYSRIEYIDVSGYPSVTVKTTGYRFYYYTYNANKTKLGANGWYSESKKIPVGATTKYLRLTVRHPETEPNVSPTEAEITGNISVYGDIATDIYDNLVDAEEDIVENAADIENNIERIAALENLSGAVFNDYDVVVGGSIKFADGSDDSSTTYSRVEYIDVGGKYSVTIDPGSLGAYIYTYNDEKTILGRDAWVYAPTTYHYSHGVKYIRLVMRHPVVQTQVSPTEAEVLSNLKITAVNKATVSNERMRQNFIPAKSTRYIYAKGKMWQYYWNTVKAIKAAAESDDCWGVSVDVRVTSDGYLVCFHDATVDNQTDGTGQIEDMTWAEVQALNIDKGVWNGSAWVAEEGGVTGKIPLLSDAIDACRLYGKVLLIEPKAKGSSAIGNLGDENTEAVISLLRDKGMLDNCGFIAPNTTQTYLVDNHPEIFRFRLYDDSLSTSNMNIYAYDPNTVFGAYNSVLTNKIVAHAHRHNQFICGYTPRTNPQSDDVEMVGKGLDAIFLFREPPILT